MRLLVVDESRNRARVLRVALEEAGHEVVVSLGAPLALLAQVERVRPDVLIIHTESPTRDVIEHLVVMREHGLTASSPALRRRAGRVRRARRDRSRRCTCRQRSSRDRGRRPAVA